MSTQTYVVQISNQDIVMRVSQTSFGQVRVMGGVPGPQGPPGPSGGGYNFTQASPSATWLINHNLGFKPSIDLFTTGGMEMLGEVVHTSVNQIIVNFTEAIAGFARLN